MHVATIERAAGLADVLITVTGRPGAVTTGVLERLKDGAQDSHFRRGRSITCVIPGLLVRGCRRP
jgi:hypothetical protein